jgi:hypothetical protein
MTLSAAQMKVLVDLAEHAGQFRHGYGKSAAALYRLGLARRRSRRSTRLRCRRLEGSIPRGYRCALLHDLRASILD